MPDYCGGNGGNWAYLNTVTTGSTTNIGTYTLPAITSGVTFIGCGSPAEPQPQTALAWLDAEVEKTCALARAA